MTKQRPFIREFVADMAIDTIHLSPRQLGAFKRLQWAMWRSVEGVLADDPAMLMSITGLKPKEWRADRPALAKLHIIVDGVWRHEALSIERDHVIAAGEDRSSKASKAAASRWAKPAPPNALRMADGCSEHAPSNAPSNARGNARSDAPGMLDQCHFRLQTSDSRITPRESSSGSPAREEPLPDGWVPSADEQERARQARPDLTQASIDSATTRFCSRARAKALTAVRWGEAWIGWIIETRAEDPAVKHAKAHFAAVPSTDPEMLQWAARLRGYRPGGMWQLGNWGPRPEAPGCRVPSKMLAAWRAQHPTNETEARAAS